MRGSSSSLVGFGGAECWVELAVVVVGKMDDWDGEGDSMGMGNLILGQFGLGSRKGSEKFYRENTG